MSYIITRCPDCKKRAETVKEFHIGDTHVQILKCGHRISWKSTSNEDYSTIRSEDGRALMPFQQEGARFLEQSGGRTLIADEMRLGKTVQLCSFLKLHPEVLPALGIVKSAILSQWQHEYMRWTGNFAQIIDSAKCHIFPGLKGYLISYDLLRRFPWVDEEIEDDFSNKKVVKVNSFRKRMRELGIKTIFIDECQQIKNPTSDRTIHVKALTREVEHIVALSGTPIKNNAAEYYPILNILHPEMFPTYQGFIANYCDAYQNGFGYKVGGLSDPEHFRARTKHFIIRRTREEVAPQMPKISRDYRFCDLGKEVEAAYVATFKAFQLEMTKIQSTNKRSFGDDSNMLAYLSKMRHLTGISKVDPCIDYCMEFLGGTDRKLTIFVHHKDVAQMLMKKLTSLCQELGLEPPCQIASEMDTNVRAANVDAFTKGNRRILIASTLASGEGLTLYPCMDCVMLERQWNPANEEQAEARFPHITAAAGMNVMATYFVAIGTVDEFFATIVEQKREIVNQTLDGKAVEWEQSSLIRELSDILMANGGKKWGL